MMPLSRLRLPLVPAPFTSHGKRGPGLAWRNATSSSATPKTSKPADATTGAATQEILGNNFNWRLDIPLSEEHRVWTWSRRNRALYPTEANAEIRVVRKPGTGIHFSA